MDTFRRKGSSIRWTQPIVVLDGNLSVTTANNAFLKTFNVARDDLLGQNFFSLGNGQWEIPELRQLISTVIPKATAIIGFEVKHEFPAIGQRTFLVDARRLVHLDDNSTNILVLFDDVTERQRRDTEKDFIISETRHRMKNLSSVVRAIAMQTSATGRTGEEYREVFLGRLDATLRAQEIAATHDATDFETLVRQSMGLPEGDANSRLVLSGPEFALPSSKVLAATLVMHELSTNAMKYGALSSPQGRVKVAWSLEPRPREKTLLRAEWREENGPRVSQPDRRGYGSELIENTIAHSGGRVELTFDEGGLVATITIPV